ncbi:Uncharacterised protein [uncultured archaeon]|nr:Uncharacterised protein [uncultured archaeon]
MIGLALKAQGQIGGVSFQDLDASDFIQSCILLQILHGDRVLVHGHDPGSILRHQQGEGPHSCEHVQHYVTGPHQVGDPEPLCAQAGGEVGAFQIHTVAHAVLFVSGDCPRLSRHVPEPARPEFPFHIREGGDDGSYVLAGGHKDRGHTLGIDILHDGNVSHHFKAGPKAQDILWAGAGLFNREFPLNPLEIPDLPEPGGCRLIDLQDRQVDAGFVGDDLSAAVEGSHLHQGLAELFAAASRDPYTTGLNRHLENLRGRELKSLCLAWFCKVVGISALSK